MTAREQRLRRLAGLRERQHHAAALTLRSARNQVAAAETAVTGAQERTRVAQLCRIAAAAGDDPQEWQLACADIQVGMLTVRTRQAELADARVQVDFATEAEAAARREKKQMETTLAAVQHDRVQLAQRKEQGTLDEIARRQPAESIRAFLSRRDL